MEGIGNRMNRMEKPLLAYLIGCYPAITHTFILREILQLREIGFDIRTVSISSPEKSADGPTETEKVESLRTFYVKARGLQNILADHARALISRPLRYIFGLWFALRLNGLDLGHLPHYVAYFVEAVVVGEWMRRGELCHLHVHFANASSTVALIVSKMYPVRYSITVHGPDEFYGEAFYRLREKIKGASFICCISQFCRSQLMKVTPVEDWPKLEVCLLGVDPTLFRPRPGPVEGEFHIACVGQLVARKGQAILLQAAAKLLRGGRRLHLEFIGDGVDRRALQELVARESIIPNVTFHGSVNQDRLRGLLGSTSVFVLPSFAEGVPVSLMEAMAMEIPCISTVIAGIPELISCNIDGILVPASDVDSLAEALEMLMDNPEYRLRLGRAGRLRVIERYNLQANTSRLAEVFQRRLELRSTHPDSQLCAEQNA